VSRRLVDECARNAFGVLFVPIPRAWRFYIAQLASRALAHVVWVRPMMGGKLQAFDGPRETALGALYRCMHRFGLPFDPVVTVGGVQPMGGTLIITAHFGLTGLLLRWLSDCGHEVSVVMYRGPANPMISGTREPLDVIPTDQLTLVRVRRRLATGRIVIALADGSVSPSRPHRVQSAIGPRGVSDHIMQFAERTRVPILFASTQVGDSGKVLIRLVRPASVHAEELCREFCQFLESVGVARQP
jgi:hypothetical protein